MADMTDAEYFGHETDLDTRLISLEQVPIGDPDTIYNVIIMDDQKEDKV
jgi:hypothetical protein